MLFQKKIEPHCVYCDRGTQLDEASVLCRKHGIVPVSNYCSAFKYDPLKRVPPRPAALNFSKLKDEDFTL